MSASDKPAARVLPEWVLGVLYGLFFMGTIAALCVPLPLVWLKWILWGEMSPIAGSLAAVGVMALVGLVCWGIGGWAADTLLHHYEMVPQGNIVSLSTVGGSQNEPLKWVVVIEGLNRAGQKRRYNHPVNAGDWHDGRYKVGDFIDLKSRASQT